MELETHLIIASNLHLIKADEFNSVSKPVNDIEKMLNRLIAVLRNTRNSGQRTRETRGEPLVPYPVSRVPNRRSSI